MSEDCKHYMLRFSRGRLACVECEEDVTPPAGMSINVVKSDFRDNVIQSLQQIANEVPDDVLHEIELYAEYLSQRHKGSEAFAGVVKMVGNSSGQHRGKNAKK